MRTIIKEQYWKILELFYKNRNKELHLREISRKIKLKECPVSRHLHKLLKLRVLKSSEKGNLKNFFIRNQVIPKIFPLFDIEKLENLPLLRKNAIQLYINRCNPKPIFLIVFGSTAKHTYKDDSDIDIIEVYNRKTTNSKAAKYVETQTGMRLSMFQMTYNDFIKELKMKEDHVIQSGINTGFPVYNNKYFYEVLYNERV